MINITLEEKINIRHVRICADMETGEVLGCGNFIPDEVVIKNIIEQDRQENIKNQKKNYVKKQTDIALLIDELGRGKGFYFANYKNLIKRLNNDTALAFRFLYLCTYADYNGIVKYNKKVITENNFGKIYSNLSINTIKSIKDKLLKTNLISIVNDNIKVCEDLYIKGSLSDTHRKKSCRVFNDGVRELYKQSKATEHKKLGKIIPLIANIHTENNILCKNPDEDESLIKPLSVAEIGALIEDNMSNYNRTVRYLLNVKINDSPLMAITKKCDGDVIAINPTIFFKGSKRESIIWLEKTFKICISSRNDEKEIL